MAGPENREEISVGAEVRVELDPDDLNMVSGFSADQSVIRVRCVALRVPNFGLDDAGHSLEWELNAPETAGAELGELVTRVVGLV